MGMEAVYKLSVLLNMVDRMSGPAGNASSAISNLQDTMDSTGAVTASMSGQLTSAESAVSSLQDKFKAAGDKISSIGSKISSVGSSLTNSITKPAAAAATALGTLALTKGFARLTGIDNARAKLMGLGHDAESITAIMDSALASVSGTSYGMDAAATTAAGAVAAGVGLGEELTRYLSLTADAAAIAGIEMSEMGSIINKVQTSGKAMTENLEQLSDRGLPIYQWLGDEAGVAASKVKEMASQGKISTEMFLAAIENNIGGAAKTMGEASFTAEMSNIGASISRIGANFLDAGGSGGGFFSTLKPLLTDFNNSLGILEDKAKEAGVAFGGMFNAGIAKVKEIRDKFSGLSPPMQNLITKGVAVGVAIAIGIGPALKIVGGLVSGIGAATTAFSVILSPVGLVVAVIIALVAAFGYLMVKNEAFRESVIGVWNGIRDRVSGIISGLKPKLQTMFDGAAKSVETIKPKIESGLSGIITGAKSVLSGMEPVISNVFATVVPIVQNLKQAVSGFFSGLSSGLQGSAGGANGLGSVFTMILGQIFPPLKMILFLFQNFAPQIQNLASVLSASLIPLFTTLGSTIGGVASAALPAMQSVMSALIPVIGEVISSITEIVGAVLPVLIDLVNQLLPFITQIVEVVSEIVSAVAPMIAQLVSSVLPVLTTIIQVVMNIVTSIMPAVIAILNVVMSVIRALIPVIQSIIQVVVNVITSVMNTINPIISFIGMVISAIMAVIVPIITFVADIIATIVSVIGTIIGTVTEIFSAVSSVVTTVWTDISSTVSGVINSISSMISSITGTVSSVFNTIYTTISTVIGNARDAVSAAIEAIKGFFNFSWSLPALKLPHISITGSFSINPPSVPSFGISWYAKGGIMTRPTAFAATGNTLHVGGEAGPEAILPLALLWEKMQTIFSGFFGNDNEDTDYPSIGSDITKTIFSKEQISSKEKTVSKSNETQRTKNRGVYVNTLNIKVDMDKIQNSEMLQKLIDELLDAQNGTDDDPVTA